MLAGPPQSKGTPGGLSQPSEVGGLARQELQVPFFRPFADLWAGGGGGREPRPGSLTEIPRGAGSPLGQHIFEVPHSSLSYLLLLQTVQKLLVADK